MEDRALGRKGARNLTVEETACVSGSITVHTNVCTVPLPPITLTGTSDGDACGAGDLDQ